MMYFSVDQVHFKYISIGSISVCSTKQQGQQRIASVLLVTWKRRSKMGQVAHTNNITI